VTPKPFEVVLELHEAGADQARMDKLTMHVITQISGLDAKARRAVSAPPSGAKSGTGLAIATVLVACASSPVLAELIGLLRDWLNRRDDRGVRLTDKDGSSIELTRDSDEEDLALLQEWLKVQQNDPANHE
jgi:hypothetical protein